jgi:membrane protein
MSPRNRVLRLDRARDRVASRLNALSAELRPKLEIAWCLVRATVAGFSKDRGDLVAAALAFYTLLSIAPLIIVAVAIAGFVLGEGEARQGLTRLMRDSLGSQFAETVNTWVDDASSSGGFASFIGGLLALLTASRLAAQLRSAMNQIWNVDVFQAEYFKDTIKHYIQRRLFAFLLVVAAGPLLLAVIVSRAVLTGLHHALFAASPLAGTVLQIAQVLFSLFIVAFVSAIVFKVVPDTHIGWRSVWIGALLTSVLFNAGNVLVGWYLGRATVTAAYGAAGSVVVLLLWMYFSAHLFLLGAEFTQAYAARFGRGLAPSEERELRNAAQAGLHRARESAAREDEKRTEDQSSIGSERKG